MNIPEGLKPTLEIWKAAQNLSAELERREIDSSYTPMSWYCLLAGYGFYPDVRDLPGSEQYQSKEDMARIDDFVRRCALDFRSQNELLASLRQ